MGRAVVNGTQTQAPLGERQQVPFMAVSQVRCFSIHNSGKENTNIEFSIECIKLLTSFDGGYIHQGCWSWGGTVGLGKRCRDCREEDPGCSAKPRAK